MSDKYFYKVAENFRLPNFKLGPWLHNSLGLPIWTLDMMTPIEKDGILQVLPPEVHPFFTVSLFTVSQAVPPHVCRNVTAMLHLYKPWGACKTTFHKPKSSDPLKISAAGVVSPDDIEDADFFVAKHNELWLLDATQIQSVSCPADGASVMIMQVATNRFTFKEVYQMLKQTGAVQDVWLG